MRLLIIGCSQTKSSRPGFLPAIERYQGVYWKIIHRALRERPTLEQELDILAISAEFGAIDGRHLIPWYERRMTRTRASKLREQIVTTINAHLMQRHYDDILICLGADYRPAIAGANLGSAHTTTGGIGEQARQLKQWLHRSPFGCEKERNWAHTIEMLQHLLDPFDALSLECDGLTTICSHALLQAAVDHTIMLGEIRHSPSNSTFAPHYWIECQ